MKKCIPLILAISIIFVLAGCGTSAEQEENSYQQVSMEEAVEIMEEETGYIILDVRTEEEFSERHIPNAINIPNESIGSVELK